MLSIDYLLSRQEKPTADQNSDRNSSKIIEESVIRKESWRILIRSSSDLLTSKFSEKADSDWNSSKIIEESNSLCILSAILKNPDQIIFWLTTTCSDEADGREICPVGKPVIQLYLRFSQQIRNAWIEIVLTVEA